MSLGHIIAYLNRGDVFLLTRIFIFIVFIINDKDVN